MIDIVKQIFGTGRKSVIVFADEDDFLELSEIHRESFPRGWSDGEFEALLAQGHYFCLVARTHADSRQQVLGFVIVKKVVDEAEIISLATRRNARRKGTARQLMDTVVRELHKDRVRTLFLEVDTKNDAAINLYTGMGFQEIDVREGYYSDPDKEQNIRSAALVMRLQLG